MRQQQEQITVLQILLVGRKKGVTVEGSMAGSNIEVTKSLVFNRKAERVGEFITVMNLFLRVGNKNNSCIRETQENSIEFLRQSSLSYIL